MAVAVITQKALGTLPVNFAAHLGECWLLYSKNIQGLGCWWDVCVSPGRSSLSLAKGTTLNEDTATQEGTLNIFSIFGLIPKQSEKWFRI